MTSTLLFVLIVSIAIAALAIGIVFVREGNRKDDNGKRNVAFLVIGWILLGLVSIGATFATIYVIWQYMSAMLIFLLFLSPLAILGGLIFSLAFGISSLVKGYSEKKKQSIIGGYICIGVFVTIVISILILIIWFANYLNAHPISLM